MAPSEDISTASSVKRNAVLMEQGTETYTLFLLENEVPVDDLTKIIDSKEAKIEGLELQNIFKFPIPGAKWAMVTKGSFLVLKDDKGNRYRYEVKEDTPFEVAKGAPTTTSNENVWELYAEESVLPWKDFADTDELKNLPGEPFLVSDKRKRYELTDRLIKRQCFDLVEQDIENEIEDANSNMRVPAISVLGAKGAGKSTFFRYFFYKHCTKRLAVYVPNAGTDANAIYQKLIAGVIFGLQCLDKDAARRLLLEVRKAKDNGDHYHFVFLWENWSKKYPDLCQSSYILIDQLQREGELFETVKNNPIRAGCYILISSTGILHHHNVTSGYGKLTYFYPVKLQELAPIDEEGKLGSAGVGQLVTMMGAISILEDEIEDLQDHYKKAALKHYQNVTALGRDYEKRLLAVVQAEGLSEKIEGVIWELVLDVNYFWIRADYKVGIASPVYMRALKELRVQDKVAYKRVLKDLLSDAAIVENVGNAALGVHVEALLDLEWQALKAFSWSQQRLLSSGATRSSRFKAQTHINGVKGRTFDNVQPISFDGKTPTTDTDEWKELDWNYPVYFKPNKSNYEGFGMFVFVRVHHRGVMCAIQVTVSDARKHDIDAFDASFLNDWNSLLKQYNNNKSPDWEFYMLTPEDNPQQVTPKISADVEKFNIPIYQISFADLAHSGDLNCGIAVENRFPELLKAKQEKKKQRV